MSLLATTVLLTLIPAISPSTWAKHRAAQNSNHMAHGDAELIWHRSMVSPIPKMGNDSDTKFIAGPMALKCLFDYNIKRVWPLTHYTDTGEEDKQSVVAMLNLDYLESLDLLDANKNFAYNPAEDKFEYKGIMYYSAGDTPVAEAKANDLFYYLILRRVDFAT